MKWKRISVVLTLILALEVILLTNGCVLSAKPMSRKIIFVKPGDPAWLVNDVPNVKVVARDGNGKFVYGVSTLKAGCVVWHDKKWNETTVSVEE